MVTFRQLKRLFRPPKKALNIIGFMLFSPSHISSIAVVLALYFSQQLTWSFYITKLSQNIYENVSVLLIVLHLFPIYKGNFQAAAVAPSLIPAATYKV